MRGTSCLIVSQVCKIIFDWLLYSVLQILACCVVFAYIWKAAGFAAVFSRNICNIYIIISSIIEKEWCCEN